MTRIFLLLPLSLLLVKCASPTNESKQSKSLIEIALVTEQITGTKEYLKSPFVTAGDRVYMVGHQDGSFPDLGWHIDGEMGGIWDHPIKLMDGFSIQLKSDEMTWKLDSASKFQNLPVGNIHTFEKDELAVKRFQFVPEGVEGLIVELTIENKSAQTKTFDVVFTGNVDLRPTWLAERDNIEDGMDEGEFDLEKAAYIAKDSKNPWYVVFGPNKSPITAGPGNVPERKGLGKDFTLETELTVESNASQLIQYFIAGSYQSQEQAIETFNELATNSATLIREKIKKYEKINFTNQLTTSDPDFDRMYEWIKYNTQWLVRDVPEIGRGVCAGIPDYPWWFGTDGAYIIQGLLSAGMHEEALSTIDLIIDLSKNENGDGKIVHEVSSNGIVFNPGNLNTTPTFIIALWKAYEWTADPRIIDQYYDDIIQGIEWIGSMDKDQNGFPDGAGMMEIHGLHSEMIDVVAYLAKAYQVVSNFAELKNDTETAKKYASKSEGLIQKINSEWWVEESNSYADFRSSKQEALELIDAAIVRSDTISKPWSVKELQETKRKAKQVPDELQGFVVHHNWVVNTPMEVGLADSDKAKKALMTAKNYQNRFGMFVTGIDRDENQEKAEKWKAFSYVGAVMTLPTGVQAIGEAKYGNMDASLEYLNMLQNSFSYALPGSMYEVSPDFGMIAQGWNIYAIAVPIVDYFFGIKPKAYDQTITISPKMPTSWNEAKLENVKIGDNLVSIFFKRTPNGEGLNDFDVYKIQQTLDWNLFLEVEIGTKLIIDGGRFFAKESVIALPKEVEEIIIIRDKE